MMEVSFCWTKTMTRGHLRTSSKGAAELPLGRRPTPQRPMVCPLCGTTFQSTEPPTPRPPSTRTGSTPPPAAWGSAASRTGGAVGAPPPPVPSPPRKGTLVSHAAAGSEQSGLQVEHEPTGPGQDHESHPSDPTAARQPGQHRLRRPRARHRRTPTRTPPDPIPQQHHQRLPHRNWTPADDTTTTSPVAADIHLSFTYVMVCSASSVLHIDLKCDITATREVIQ